MNDNFNTQFRYSDENERKSGGRVFGAIAIVLVVLITFIMLILLIISGDDINKLPESGAEGSFGAAMPSQRPPGGGSEGSGDGDKNADKGDGDAGKNNGMQIVTGGPSSTTVPDGSTIGQILASEDNPVVRVAEEMKESVVGISAMVAMSDSRGVTDYMQYSYGSGVIIEGDFIITNHHVINGADAISVTFFDGQILEAQIVGSDDINDIAVLMLSQEREGGLKPAKLGVSGDLNIGQMAIAIGNPLGEYFNTVTFGAISALDRDLTVDGKAMILIQTDAAINSGNSGGPLLNASGEVIGINTYQAAAYTGSASARKEGLNFAIPVDIIKPVINEIIRIGKYTRPGLGIVGYDFTELQAAYYEYYEEIKGLMAGLYVSEVPEGGGAAIAGVMAGDIVTHIDGTRVETFTQLRQYLEKNNQVGDSVMITLIRYEEESNSFLPTDFSITLIPV
ncbi:MAG: S1C family serine protease [Christensenellales bacterium]|jgi:serine protease Do